MAADYIEILFGNISRIEVIKIMGEINYDIDDIKNAYYYSSSDEGNEPLTMPQVINLINNKYNITTMFGNIIMFGIKLHNVLAVVNSGPEYCDLTFNFEKESFDNGNIKENIVNAICRLSEGLEDSLIYIGHEPVEDEDMRNLEICGGQITYINKEDGYWDI